MLTAMAVYTSLTPRITTCLHTARAPLLPPGCCVCVFRMGSPHILQLYPIALQKYRFELSMILKPHPGKLTLTYFEARGRAEAIRVAMHDHGIEFEDVTFT